MKEKKTKRANKNYETQRKVTELFFMSAQIFCKLSFEHRRRNTPFSDFVFHLFGNDLEIQWQE